MKRSVAQNRRIKWWLAGFLAQGFLLLCIVHEMGHAVAAILSGARVLRMTWVMTQTNLTTPFILAAGYLTEFVLWGTIAVLCTKRWSRVGFFFIGAFSGATWIWWLSADRMMMIEMFGGTGMWDLVFAGLIVMVYTLRRRMMWADNAHLMALVTGREDPWRNRRASNSASSMARVKG